VQPMFLGVLVRWVVTWALLCKRPPQSAFGMLDKWVAIWPAKRAAFKAAELIAHDRILRGE